MAPNPPVGVMLHAIGGLMSAIFYLPYRKVRFWAWESYWIVGGVFSWIIAPWVIALLAVPNVTKTLLHAPVNSLCWSCFFGVLWGVGGLTFGLTVRYLGFALGTAMALGYCAVFGTLIPPIFSGEFGGVIKSTAGLVVLGGVAVCVLGIVVSGMAGIAKERELPEKEKTSSVKEFSFKKGVWVATFCGIMSACMSYGFAAGKPIAALAVENGAPDLWKNLPVLIVILAGGFMTNFIWCVILNIRNGTSGDYLRGNTGAGAERVPLTGNYLLCAVAGTVWYLQFFFYGMGTTKMGRYDFSSWTLHMASIMIFGTLVGLILAEWKGVTARTHCVMRLGLVMLISSTVIIGWGNRMAAEPATKAAFDPFASEEAAAKSGARLVSLEELLKQADFVSIHCPLTDQTRGLIGARKIALMKPDAYLLNTARGGIVDEDALFAALKERRIAGAALDCFAEERVTKPSRFGELDNVLLAPHAIAWTGEMFRDIGRTACAGVVELSLGRRPAGIVNPEVLERPGFKEKWNSIAVSSK
jgi:L-rhamnose-H+ transport protein